MPKKILEFTPHDYIPHALIIGEGILANYLSEILKDRGCLVQRINNNDEIVGRFDYVIQLGNFAKVEKIRNQNLNSNGKFLFLETYEEEITKKEGIKILRIGDESSFKLSELAEKSLKFLFSSDSKLYRDIKIKKIYRKEIITNDNVVPEKKLEEVVIKYKIRKEKIHSTPLVNPQKVVHFNFLKITMMIASLIFISVLLSTLYFSYKFFVSLSYFKNHLNSGNISEVREDLKASRKNLYILKTGYDLFYDNIFLLQYVPFLQDVRELFIGTDDLLVRSSDLLEYSKSVINEQDVTGITRVSINNDSIDNLIKKLNTTRESILLSKRQMEKMPSFIFPKDDYLNFLSSNYLRLTESVEVLPILNKVLLGQEERIYLLLFQNNMELRPTGGFIGSYGLLTTGLHGMNVTLYDVYTADGQLKGHVEPPEAIRKYLNQPNYFLRDSNFDPDFAVSADKASWFLEKELGIKVNGVVGVNLYLLEKIFKAMGPIVMTDFNNEEINYQNFFARAHYYSEDKFFPGSTQKKDFLTSLANSLILKSVNAKPSTLIDLLPVVKRSFEDKSLMFFSYDREIQKEIENLNLGGRVSDLKCVESKDQMGKPIDTSSCLADYISTSEANLGVNKANYYINKSVVIEKEFTGDGSINSTLTVTYLNNSTVSIKPSPTYVSYIRIFVPRESLLKTLTINSVPIDPKQIDTGYYGTDKSFFGFLMNLAPENKAVIKASYLIPQKLSLSVNTYELIYQKQPGDRIAPLVLSLVNNSENKLNPVNFQSGTGKDKEIFYTTDTTVDRIFVLSK